MAKSVIFNMAAAAILDFVGYGFLRSKLFRDLIFCLSVKLRVKLWIRSKTTESSLFNWFQDGGRPPFWIYFRCQFLSFGRLRV